jgi:DDB1- and CUL4-associated factor 13
MLCSSNAVKLEKMFKKPFIGDFGRGHVEGVYSFAKDPDSLERFASSSGDGVVKVWDLSTRKEVWAAKAHENVVKSTCWTKDRKLLTAAADKTVKLWDPYNTESNPAPTGIYLGSQAFNSLTHHRDLPNFAVSSSVVSIYDLSRPSTAPTQTLSWPTSSDTITCLRFNQVETSILAATSTDRGVVLFDVRTDAPLSKNVLTFACNSLSWNPMEAFNFAVASEDHNAYQFDMRNMKRALNVHKDHVAAIMDIEFSPTGEELVTGAYDRTIRLWNRSGGRSRDVYFTKRMQRVFCATFTADSQYVLSGSDDGNVRLWRADPSSRAGVQSARQEQKLTYDRALVARYGHLPELRRIKNHTRVPNVIKKAREIKRDEEAAIKRRVENERKHSKKGKVPRQPEREKMVLGEGK